MVSMESSPRRRGTSSWDSLVRQFRYPYGEELLELPAGKREPGEDPRLCGIRELEEETGYQAGEFLPRKASLPFSRRTRSLTTRMISRTLGFPGQSKRVPGW